MDKVEGLIAFYKLQQWWFSSFTPEERTYIDDCYQPMGTLAHRLTQGIILERKEPAPEFLNELNTWFRSKNDSTIAERIHQKLIELAKQEPIVEPGYYEGRHYTTYIRDFKILKKSGKYEELESLLAELVRATEEESAANGMGVAPAYYNELAILYRKQKEYSKEITILERFAKQRHAGGVLPTRLLERLRKARQREAAQTKTSG
jgi:hypothetical protein